MSGRDDFDTLAPTFEVHVNGAKLSNEARADLIGVSVLDDVEAAGMFTLTMACWDAGLMQAKWIDDKLFREGNPVEISLGYRDQPKQLIAGEITAIEPEFAQGRPPTLTLRGHDLRHRLMRSRRTRSFVETKDSDIAGRLASEAGLMPQVEDSRITLPYVLQHNQSDFEFLMARAQRIGYEFLVRDRNLIFRPRKADGSELATLRREIELLDFRPRLSTFGQIPELEVRGWDPATKKEIVGKARAGDEARAMGDGAAGPSATRRAFDPPASARVDLPVHSQAEADQLARCGFVEMALGYVRAQGTCIGDPRLLAGTVVKIEGVGTRFSGRYYLTSVEHRYGPNDGYRTRFSARRNAT
jgi:phage protein D